MNRNSIYFLIVFSLVSSYSASSINYKNKQLALISFNVSISPQIMDMLNGLNPHFPDSRNPKMDKVIKRLKDVTWNLLEERLEREIGMYILPINSFGNQFDYDEYEYPNTSINKAIRRGNAKFYLKIDMVIDFELVSNPTGYGSSTRSKRDTSSAKNSDTQPEPKTRVSIVLTTYSEKGILPVDKFTGFVMSEQPLVFDENVLNGLVNEQLANDTSSVMGLINNGISNLILNFFK
jgi:hypothetical protein